MRSIVLCIVFLLPHLAQSASGAAAVSVTKVIPAQASPWVVTASLNYAYPVAWIIDPVLFSAADGLAFQAGDVLTIQYSSGLWCSSTYVGVGTCVDANGYPQYPANDAACGTVYYPSKYMNPAAYPINSMELVGTFANAAGQIVGQPFKVGNGPVGISVPTGAARLQLGSNGCDRNSARDYYSPLNVTVSGPPPPTMHEAGSMAQLAVAGYWKTTVVLVNPGSTPAQAQLNFFDNNGNPLSLPLTFPEAPAAPALVSSLNRTLAAGASLTFESGGPDSQATQVGWAQLLTDGDLSGFAIFRLKVGDYDQEAVVPLEDRNPNSYHLWYDNTGPMVTGLALANLLAQFANVAVTIRDESGAIIGTDSIPLAAHGHTSFELPVRLPSTAARRGTVEFRPPAGGRISLLGLRFHPGAFTTIPVLAN